MAYFDRTRGPVTMDVGPVLDLEDLAASKNCALASRVEPRDYIDTAAALQRYSVGQLIGLARRIDPGLEDRDFADAGAHLDRMPDGVFTRYGLSPADVARLREEFRAWPGPEEGWPPEPGEIGVEEGGHHGDLPTRIVSTSRPPGT